MDAPERPKRRMKAEPPPLAELVGRRHKDLDPTDPVFIVATIVEELQKQTLAEMGELVTSLADQIAAANRMAKNAAKAKAEKIVTQATEFAAMKISEAGVTVSVRLAAETQRAQAALSAVSARLKWATIAAVVCSVAALSAAVSTGIAIWVG